MIHLKEQKEIVVNEFNPEAANKFRAEVIDASIKNPEMPIIVIINSPGGQVTSLIQMIDVMEEVPNRFVTVCTGVAASCGAILLSVGDARFITKHSDVMIHRVSAATWGDVKNMKGDIRQFEKFNMRVMKILADKCGKTIEDLEALLKESDNQEIWLNAEEAKAFGIVDYIGTPDLKPDIAWHLSQTPVKEKAVAYHPDEVEAAKEAIKKGLEKVAKKPTPKVPAKKMEKLKKIIKKSVPVKKKK